MNKPALPEEQSEEDLEAAFRKVVQDATAWAANEEMRDRVMSALYDVLVGVGPHDGEDPEP
jgi:hypothetical protein